MRCRCAAIGLWFLLTTYAAPGVAQISPEAAGTGSPDEQAAKHYEEGVKAARRGELDRAYEAFLSAWNEKRHFQIAANLGMTELQLGKHRDAAVHLSYFLRESAGVSEGDRRIAQEMFD